MNEIIRTEQTSFRRMAFRIASVAMAGIVAAVISGCGSNAGTPAASGSEAGAAPAAASTTAPAETPQDQGKQVFTQSCSNCHGMDGQGVPHLGADLQTSKLVAKSTDEQLANLIEKGIPANDPRNTSHIPMPPKGANPTLTKRDIQDVVLYIRQVQKEHARAK